MWDKLKDIVLINNFPFLKNCYYKNKYFENHSKNGTQ